MSSEVFAPWLLKFGPNGNRVAQKVLTKIAWVGDKRKGIQTFKATIQQDMKKILGVEDELTLNKGQ